MGSEMSALLVDALIHYSGLEAGREACIDFTRAMAESQAIREESRALRAESQAIRAEADDLVARSREPAIKLRGSSAKCQSSPDAATDDAPEAFCHSLFTAGN